MVCIIIGFRFFLNFLDSNKLVKFIVYAQKDMIVVSFSTKKYNVEFLDEGEMFSMLLIFAFILGFFVFGISIFVRLLFYGSKLFISGQNYRISDLTCGMDPNKYILCYC